MKPRPFKHSEQRIAIAERGVAIAKKQQRIASETLEVLAVLEDLPDFRALEDQRSDIAAAKAHAQEVLERPSPDMTDVAGRAKETLVWLGRLQQSADQLWRLEKAAEFIADDLNYYSPLKYSATPTSWAEGASSIGNHIDTSPVYGSPVDFDDDALNLNRSEAHRALLDGGELALRDEVVRAVVELFNGGFLGIAQDAKGDSWAVAAKDNTLAMISRLRAPLAERVAELEAEVAERIDNAKRIVDYRAALKTVDASAQVEAALGEYQFQRAMAWRGLADGAPSATDREALIEWAQKVEVATKWVAHGSSVENAEATYRRLVLSNSIVSDTATPAPLVSSEIEGTPTSLTTRTGRGADKGSGPSFGRGLV